MNALIAVYDKFLTNNKKVFDVPVLDVSNFARKPGPKHVW